MRITGVIEGFYGKPWTHEERLDLIRFSAEKRFNTWVYAPKDDPYHRAKWREPYPDAELAQLGELVTACNSHGLEFAYAIAPGLDLCYSKESEWQALIAKCEQIKSVGVRTFQLLWDDIEHTMNCPEDEALYGHEERPSAAAQAPFSNRFAKEFEQPGPLVICPMGYAGTGDSPYRKILGPRLDPEIICYWTGPEVVSWGITREALDLAVYRYRDHEILIWDNYPVNDFDPGRLFLAPFLGRDPRIAEGHCAGLIANAMIEATASKLPLATIADWCNDPHGYDPLDSFAQALRDYGAEVLASLGEPADGIEVPADIPGLVQALLLGVDAATGAALLKPFV